MSGEHTFHRQEGDGNIIMFTVAGDTPLPGMLETFERYLRACGFVFDGSVDLLGDGEK